MKTPRRFLVVAVALVALVVTGPVAAQQQPPPNDIAALKKQIEELRAALAAVQKDVQETLAILKRVTEPPPPPSPVSDAREIELPLGGIPERGSRAATVAIVEFSDFQCPFCSRYAAQTWPQVNREYVESGKVQYFFVGFPLEELHPQAFKAHEAATCAAEQNKFWEMHDRLFANQTLLAPPELAKHAAALGLDMARFQPCLDSDRTGERVRRDLALGSKAGVNGTPAFLIGSIEPNGTTVKGLKLVSGAVPFSTLKPVVDEALGGTK